jgi:hypothetical protein
MYIVVLDQREETKMQKAAVFGSLLRLMGAL